MKKNMISVLILALLIVNIVLTAIMMFSVTNASRKTAALVDDISSALHLELGDTQEKKEAEAVPMANIDTYEIADQTEMLKTGEDGVSHFCQVSVTLSMNKKHKDYKTYSDLSTKENLIKSEIIEAFSEYTLEEAQTDTEALKADILQRVQTLFGSDFIFDVSFSSILYQ